MTDRTIQRSRHDWFRARIVLHVLGLLDEDAEREFLKHAAECSPCDAEWREFDAGPPERLPDGAHVPARVLARWDRSRERLSGVAREIVRRHLETCAECRADLEHIGYEPELPERAGVNTAVTSRGTGDGERVPEPTPTSQPTMARAGRTRWIVIGAFGGAVAASLALVPFMKPSQIPHDPASTEPAPAPPHVAPSHPAVPPSSATEMGRLPDPIALRAPSRGTTNAGEPLVVRAPGRVLVLQLPDLYLAPGARVQLTLLGPGDEVLVRRDEEATSLSRRGLVVVRTADAPWPIGTYRLEARPLAAGGTAGPLLARFEFRIAGTES